MPYFPDKNLLFIHIPKNAGRSIEEALLVDDKSPDGGRRNVVNRLLHGLSVLTGPRLPQSHLIGTLDIVLAAQHLTFLEIESLGLLSTQMLAKSERFAVCRNPYDRVISSVNHFLDPRDHKKTVSNTREFARALDTWLEREPLDHNERAHKRPQIEYLFDKTGRSAIDNVLRYEHLAADFTQFMTRVGLEQTTLPWRGRSQLDTGYREYYDAECRRRVEQAFGEDIDAFEYLF